MIYPKNLSLIIHVYFLTHTQSAYFPARLTSITFTILQLFFSSEYIPELAFMKLTPMYKYVLCEALLKNPAMTLPVKGKV